jgi:hypothetical protein
MKKTVIVLVLGGIIAMVWTMKIRSGNREQELKTLQESPERGTIEWHVRLAKTKGENRAYLPREKVTYEDEVKNLAEAMRHFAAIIATPIQRTSMVYHDSVMTWYKFRIEERLSEGTPLQCADCFPTDLEVPPQMLPVASDELLIPRNGGSVKVDGVSLIAEEVSFSQFRISHKYLLFLQIDPSKNVALLKMGPTGVFTMDGR